VRWIARIFRLIRINFILMRYNIEELVLGRAWIPFRFLIYFNPYYWRLNKKMPRGKRMRCALEELGPIFVKIGQMASTRRDLLPDDIALELAKLQDHVPPFSGQKAKEIIEQALKQPMSALFADFDQNALASASIAQVHTARLLNNESVVIKVLRPNIRKMIERDVDLLMVLARLAERYLPHAKYFKPCELVMEVAQTLFNELDLTREGANASQFKRNFAHFPFLHIPKIYWEYSHHQVLVMERIHGIPIYDLAGLNRAKINLKKLAERGINIFLTQIFRDSFFHADLHPGNIFVSPDNPEDPTYVIVDFGIVGSLSHADQRYLAENMLAFFKRDYQRVAELHIACGWLSPDTRIDQFSGAIRAVSEPIFEQPLGDISLGKLLLRLFQVARQFNINIQPQLVLLQKTLVNIEGLSRQLSPDLDLWALATPQIEKWMKQQVGLRALMKRVRSNLPLWSRQLPEIPSLLYEVLEETKQRQEKQRFLAQSQLPIMFHSRAKWIYFLAGMGVMAIIMGVLSSVI